MSRSSGFHWFHHIWWSVQVMKLLIMQPSLQPPATSSLLLTYSLTPWCRTLFEKLVVTLLVKKYPGFCMEPNGSLPYSIELDFVIVYSYVSYMCYKPCPSHPLWFDYPNNIWWRVHLTKFLMKFSPSFCFFLFLSSKCYPQHYVLKHPQSVFFPSLFILHDLCNLISGFISLSKFILYLWWYTWKSCQQNTVQLGSSRV